MGREYGSGPRTVLGHVNFGVASGSLAQYPFLAGWSTTKRPTPPSFPKVWMCVSLALGTPSHWSSWTPAKAAWVCSPSSCPLGNGDGGSEGFLEWEEPCWFEGVAREPSLIHCGHRAIECSPGDLLAVDVTVSLVGVVWLADSDCTLSKPKHFCL